MTDSLLKLPTRTEHEARRDRAVRNVREAAIREGHDPEAAENSLRSAYVMSDWLRSIGGSVG